MRTQRIRVSSIHVGERKRPDINMGTVESIAASIREIGLQNPISIYFAKDYELDGEVYASVPVLSAGVHRLKALLMLGPEFEYTDAVVFDDERSAKLWEISENLHRADLTIDERSEHRKEWLRLMGIVDEEGEIVQSPQLGKIESKREDGRGHRPEGGLSLAARTMPKLDGKSDKAKEHQLRRDLLIASRTPEAKEACRTAGLDNIQSALIEVARTPKEEQVAKVQEIAERRAAPKPPRPKPADQVLAEIVAGMAPSLAAEHDASQDVSDQARSAMEVFGKANMPFLIALLEGSPRRLAAEIRRLLECDPVNGSPSPAKESMSLQS